MESSQKINLAFDLLRDAEEKIATVRHLLENPNQEVENIKTKKSFNLDDNNSQNIIEGIFDGQSMIGSDKKIYPVPANYASKSKLVEGDTLKLTIVDDGSFIYKQIGPVERRNVRGVLKKDERGEYFAQAEHKIYKVLLASVTYFKGLENDEVTLILPKSGKSTWAAIENVIKNAHGAAMPKFVKDSMDQLQNDVPEANKSHYDPSGERSIPVTQSESDTSHKE